MKAIIDFEKEEIEVKKIKRSLLLQIQRGQLISVMYFKNKNNTSLSTECMFFGELVTEGEEFAIRGFHEGWKTYSHVREYDVNIPVENIEIIEIYKIPSTFIMKKH